MVKAFGLTMEPEKSVTSNQADTASHVAGNPGVKCTTVAQCSCHPTRTWSPQEEDQVSSQTSNQSYSSFFPTGAPASLNTD